MGAWGDRPWESDAGSDFGHALLASTWVQVERLCANSEEIWAARDADQIRVACDILVRLQPYWTPAIGATVSAALRRLRTAHEYLRREGADLSYDAAICDTLEAACQASQASQGGRTDAG